MTRAERLARWAWQEVKADRPAAAVDALSEALRLSGRAPPHLKALSVALAKCSDAAGAVTLLEELVAKTPLDVEAWCMLG
jgi:cytochrome c-type biogenesis protein CcmH/NrfG